MENTRNITDDIDSAIEFLFFSIECLSGVVLTTRVSAVSS